MHNSPILAGKWAILKKITATEKNPKTVWRRGWDSNPRLSFPNTRFPSVLLKPLGHLSAFLGRQKPNKLPAPQQTGELTWVHVTRIQEGGLIRCNGVFYWYLTAYTVVRQEVPDDHTPKNSSGKARATQGRSGSDQRSPSRLSHRPIPQVW